MPRVEFGMSELSSSVPTSRFSTEGLLALSETRRDLGPSAQLSAQQALVPVLPPRTISSMITLPHPQTPQQPGRPERARDAWRGADGRGSIPTRLCLLFMVFSLRAPFGERTPRTTPTRQTDHHASTKPHWSKEMVGVLASTWTKAINHGPVPVGVSPR